MKGLQSYLFVGGSLHAKRLDLKESTTWFHYLPPTMVHAHSPEPDAMFDKPQTIEIYERRAVEKQGRGLAYKEHEYHLWTPPTAE